MSHFGSPLGKYIDLLPPNHKARQEYRELLIAAEGGLVALKLGKHVDVQAAIKFLEEVLAKARGLK